MIDKKRKIPETNIDVSIIIVTYNCRDETLNCIKSIYKEVKKINFEVIIVDNNSKDDTVELLKKTFTNLKIIENKKNIGFAAAVNQGIFKSKGKYILVLNPDTEVVGDCVKIMFDFLKNDRKVGITGGKLLWPDRRTQILFMQFPTLKAQLIEALYLHILFPKNRIISSHYLTNRNYNTEREVDVVSGACMMVRKEVMEKIGYFDEDLFIYAEDVDFCYRTRENGWKIFYLPYAQVMHHRAQSTKLHEEIMLAQAYKSRKLFLRKHYGKFYSDISNFITILAFSLRATFSLSMNIILLFSKEKRSFHRRNFIKFYRALRFYLYRGELKNLLGINNKPHGQSLQLSSKPESYYAAARSEMMEFIPQGAKKILDVGCGEAVFSWKLKQKLNAEVWGIEIDSSAAALAQKKIDKVLIGDISQLIDNLPNSYFDCIIINDVLEHLVDPFGILLAIKIKINTSGVIVCSIPNVRYFPVLKDLLIKKQWRYGDIGILDKTHLRFFTKKSIIDMFNSLGYNILRIEGINPIKTWKFKLLIVFSLGYLSDTKYPQFVCVVEPK